MKTKIRFIENRWKFAFLSIFLMAASLYFIFVRGLSYGVDFNGGVKLIYQFDKEVDEAGIRKALEGGAYQNAEVIRFDAENKSETKFLIKLKYEEGAKPSEEITSELGSALGAENIKLLSEEIVGPKVGSELKTKAIFAIVLSSLLILIYVGFRFDFIFAPGAVVALVHDVLISVGVFAFSGREFDLTILAAILTIIGYSINDTIVIYDRIRENIRNQASTTPLTQIVNQSLNETLSRTIITSLTVFFSVVILFIFGGDLLRGFALCMIVGTIAGSYSTLFIASPIYLFLQRKFPTQGMAKGKKI